MENSKTKHEPESKDYKDKLELNKFLHSNIYSLEDTESNVKEEFKTSQSYDDSKNDIKNKIKFELKNENDTKTSIHFYNNEDYNNKFELKVSLDRNKYSLKAEKSVKEEFEAKNFYKDSKYDFKAMKLTELKNESESKTSVCDSDKTIKQYKKLNVKDTSKIFLLKSKNNLDSQKEEAMKSGNMKYEEDRDLNHTPSKVDSRYPNSPFAGQLQQNDSVKKKYSCVHCSYNSDKRYELIQHLSTHSVERPFECAHCRYSSVRKTTLRKHIVAMHLSNNNQNPLNNTENTNSKRPFKCISCNASYIYRYSLKKHTLQHHRASGKIDEHNIPSCKVCKFSSHNPFVMKNHSLTHAMKSFKCEKCQVSFSRSDVLKHHIFLHHTAENVIFQCTACDGKFRTERGLLKHQQSLTCARTEKAKTSTPKFVCTFCSKAYFYKSVLNRHMVTHTKQYSFKCTHCARGFPTYTLLRYHIYSHSKETRFRCSACNFCTDHLSTLRTHEAHHRKYSSYKCEHCNYCTKKCDLFIKHQEGHKVDATFQCGECSYSTDKRQCFIKHLKLHSM